MNNYKKLTMDSKSELNVFLGKKLTNCFRRFYEDQVDESLYEQIDGDILLVFGNELKLILQADTESFSVRYQINPLLNEEKFTLISDRAFWKNKIGKEILTIELKTSDNRENPYGLSFSTTNETFEISYQSEIDGDFDCISIQ